MKLLLRAREFKDSETNRSTETCLQPNYQVSCESEAPLQIPFIRRRTRLRGLRKTKAEDLKRLRINSDRSSSIDAIDAIDECVILTTKKVIENKFSSPSIAVTRQTQHSRNTCQFASKIGDEKVS